MDESSYSEGLASHTFPESCLGVRKGAVEALTGADVGRVLSSEILIVSGADAVASCGRQYRACRQSEMRPGPAESETPRTRRSTSRGSREIPRLAWFVQVRALNPKGPRERCTTREVGWVRSTCEALEQRWRCAAGRGEGWREGAQPKGTC